MKTYALQIVTGLICGGVLLAWGCSTAERRDWKILQTDAYGNTFSYDASSLQHLSAGTVTVRAKSLSAEYLYEMDCANKRARLLQETGAAPQWFAVVSGSAEALLYRAVCP
jgi:hypothetical protein